MIFYTTYLFSKFISLIFSTREYIYCESVAISPWKLSSESVSLSFSIFYTFYNASKTIFSSSSNCFICPKNSLSFTYSLSLSFLLCFYFIYSSKIYLLMLFFFPWFLFLSILILMLISSSKDEFFLFVKFFTTKSSWLFFFEYFLLHFFVSWWWTWILIVWVCWVVNFLLTFSFYYSVIFAAFVWICSRDTSEVLTKVFSPSFSLALGSSEGLFYLLFFYLFSSRWNYFFSSNIYYYGISITSFSFFSLSTSPFSSW